MGIEKNKYSEFISIIYVSGFAAALSLKFSIHINGGMFMQLLGFCIKSKNVIAMVNFYKKVLNAEAIGEGDVHYDINLPDGKGGFTIWDNGEVSDTVNEKIEIAFLVDNVDEEYERLLKMNVSMVESPVDNPWGARHMLFCDPDGNQIRFVTPL